MRQQASLPRSVHSPRPRPQQAASCLVTVVAGAKESGCCRRTEGLVSRGCCRSCQDARASITGQLRRVSGVCSADAGQSAACPGQRTSTASGFILASRKKFPRVSFAGAMLAHSGVIATNTSIWEYRHQFSASRQFPRAAAFLDRVASPQTTKNIRVFRFGLRNNHKRCVKTGCKGI